MRTHGRTYTKEYQSWCSAKGRCLNPRNSAYRYYGGRGIKMCDRWRYSFENFFEDMGPCPVGMSIDRFPDSDGNYEPGNCRWATAMEQASNQSRIRTITSDGITDTMAGWARRLGVNYFTLHYRITRLGWSAERALTANLTTRRQPAKHTNRL